MCLVFSFYTINVCVFLAASTKCSAGSNDHFVVGGGGGGGGGVGGVPSLVQWR
jgi:hypothetical protein